MRVKMSKQPPTASAVGPCPTVIQIVGRPGTRSLPRTIAPPDHPSMNGICSGKIHKLSNKIYLNNPEMLFWLIGWLVGCFGLNGSLRQYYSLYRAVSQREGGGREMIHERKNVQTSPTRTYCKRSRPLPYCNPNLKDAPASEPLPPQEILLLESLARTLFAMSVQLMIRSAEPPEENRYENWNTLIYHFSLLSPSLWEKARYRLK